MKARQKIIAKVCRSFFGQVKTDVTSGHEKIKFSELLHFLTIHYRNHGAITSIALVCGLASSSLLVLLVFVFRMPSRLR